MHATFTACRSQLFCACLEKQSLSCTWWLLAVNAALIWPYEKRKHIHSFMTPKRKKNSNHDLSWSKFEWFHTHMKTRFNKNRTESVGQKNIEPNRWEKTRSSRPQVETTLGFTCSGGVATNKILAKCLGETSNTNLLGWCCSRNIIGTFILKKSTFNFWVQLCELIFDLLVVWRLILHDLSSAFETSGKFYGIGCSNLKVGIKPWDGSRWKSILLL